LATLMQRSGEAGMSPRNFTLGLSEQREGVRMMLNSKMHGVKEYTLNQG